MEPLDGPPYIEDSEEQCPRCGGEMRWQECLELHCNDGVIDLGFVEVDPLWYAPADVMVCTACKGRGFIEWCRICGYTVGEDSPVVDDGACAG